MNTNSGCSAKPRNRNASRSKPTASPRSRKRSAREFPNSYLRWRGIEATLALAQSPNTKIVIIGSGKDGLPIILGNDVPTVPGAPPAGAPPAGSAGFSGQHAANAGAECGAARRRRVERKQGARGIVRRGDAAAIGQGRRRRTPATPANNEGQAASTSPLTLPDVQSIISRISGVLLPPGAGAGSATAAKPKP